MTAWTGYRTYNDMQEVDGVLADLHGLQAANVAAIEIHGADGAVPCFATTTPDKIIAVVTALSRANRVLEPSQPGSLFGFTFTIHVRGKEESLYSDSGNIYAQYPHDVYLSVRSAKQGPVPPAIVIEGWGPWILERIRQGPCRRKILGQKSDKSSDKSSVARLPLEQLSR